MQSNGTRDPLLLTCWKDIARYMGKGVRTVQRWEQKLDLPVRRPQGNAYKSAVVARAQDLDQWLTSRWSRRNGETTGRSGSAGQPALRTELNIAIETSRQLRAVNHELVREMSSTLATLVQNCREISLNGANDELQRKRDYRLPGNESGSPSLRRADHC